MALRITWDLTYEANPADGDQASTLGDVIRLLKQDIRERGEVDHDWDDTVNAGKHNKVTLQQLAVKPANATDEGYVYQKDVSGVGELFYEDEDGLEIQLTVVGEINAAAMAAYTKDLVVTGSDVLIDNAQHYQAENAAAAAKGILGITAGDIVEVGHDDFPTRILIDDKNGLSVLFDGGADQEVMHKGNHGVASGFDADLIQGFNFATVRDISIKGHVSLPGGLLLNWAKVTDVPNTGKPDTFDQAFTVVYGATVSGAEDNIGDQTYYESISTTIIDLKTSGSDLDIFYIAIGSV